ncbi:DUF1835 domain-containing protein [Sporosarcina sp. YIM B06819]|uniref:DUF1835 domain-containing protein n=1 Tax=Sporosarcina sp. YIM B06819 TaxID=3081769 RepID=UPI00298CBB34|nr:DUF1835 domain-containing protein [Sporosarcina sp. YIM B06819]
MNRNNQLKQAIFKLSEPEAKSLLFQLFLQAETNETAQFVTELREVKHSLMNTAPTGHAQTVHIVFGDSTAGSLRIAFHDTVYKETEQVLVLPDILSVGPVKGLHTKEGLQARFHWLKDRFQDAINKRDAYMHGMTEAFERLKAIPSYQDIVIWTGNNAHEQAGLRLVLALLKDKWNTIYILNTFAAFHEIHIYPALEEENYPKTSRELSSDELLHFYEQCDMRPLRQAKREMLCKEGWNMLLEEGRSTVSNEPYLIRTWKNNELWHNTNIDCDDDFIIACAKRMHAEEETSDFIKAARVVGEVCGHMEQYRGIEWIEYRLRCLIEQGIFDYEGDLKAMRFYQVKVRM